MGGLLGAVFGCLIGGFIALWFEKGTADIAFIIIFHGGCAGLAMGAWVLPTLAAGPEEAPLEITVHQDAEPENGFPLTAG